MDLRARAIKELAQEARYLAVAIEEVVRRNSAHPAPGRQAAMQAGDKALNHEVWKQELLSIRAVTRMGWDEVPVRKAAERTFARWESIGHVGSRQA